MNCCLRVTKLINLQQRSVYTMLVYEFKCRADITELTWLVCDTALLPWFELFPKFHSSMWGGQKLLGTLFILVLPAGIEHHLTIE